MPLKAGGEDRLLPGPDHLSVIGPPRKQRFLVSGGEGRIGDQQSDVSHQTRGEGAHQGFDLVVQRTRVRLAEKQGEAFVGIDDADGRTVRLQRQGVESDTAWPERRQRRSGGDTLFAGVGDNILAGHAQPETGYADSVRSLRLAEAARQSLKTGLPVRV